MKYHIYYPTFLLLPSNASYYVMKSLLATHSLKKHSVIAKPIPVAPPVTTTVFLFIYIIPPII